MQASRIHATLSLPGKEVQARGRSGERSQLPTTHLAVCPPASQSSSFQMVFARDPSTFLHPATFPGLGALFITWPRKRPESIQKTLLPAFDEEAVRSWPSHGSPVGLWEIRADEHEQIMKSLPWSLLLVECVWLDLFPLPYCSFLVPGDGKQSPHGTGKAAQDLQAPTCSWQPSPPISADMAEIRQECAFPSWTLRAPMRVGPQRGVEHRSSVWSSCFCVSGQENHGLTEWFGLEGTFKDPPVQPPCQGQGHLPLDQVAQSPVQADLEHLQGWGIHSFSGQPMPVPPSPFLAMFPGRTLALRCSFVSSPVSSPISCCS